MIRSVKDIVDAYDAGRWHSQRFMKNSAYAAQDNVWWDWSYSSGQPAYDARIGTSLVFTPVTAVKNDAMYFPPIPAGMERRLAGVSVFSAAGGPDQASVDFQMYDIVGYYPLIDGDSTDAQVFDNTLTIPRYADGEGVFMVMVNHVSPGAGSATATINYVNNLGASRSTTWRVYANGLNRVSGSVATGGAIGPLFVPLAQSCRGVKSVTSVTFDVAPGGLWAIYLVKPIATVCNRSQGPATTNQRDFVEKCFCNSNGFNLPVIPDGASLGFFFLSSGISRSVAQVFGEAAFIWG